MKFIHIADVHWGARPEREQTFGRIREQEIKETFQRVIDHANKQQADLLLIAGDLFDQPPTQQELREVDYLLSRLNHTRTVLIAGNHDHLEPHDVFSQYKWNSEVYLLDGKQRDHISFEDLETTIYGFSYWKKQITKPLYESHIPIQREALKWSGFDYIALGHIHKPEIIFEDLMAYAGSLEPLNHTETGYHGMIEGEISEEKKQITFAPFAKRMYTQVEVMISDEMSALEIVDRVETELSYRGRENIYEIVLTGSIDPQIHLDFYEITSQYMVTDIIYETRDQWEYEQLSGEDDFIIQKVADILKDEPEALRYAMEALTYAREK